MFGPMASGGLASGDEGAVVPPIGAPVDALAPGVGLPGVVTPPRAPAGLAWMGLAPTGCRFDARTRIEAGKIVE
jgi:hypothetical protein